MNEAKDEKGYPPIPMVQRKQTRPTLAKNTQEPTRETMASNRKKVLKTMESRIQPEGPAVERKTRSDFQLKGETHQPGGTLCQSQSGEAPKSLPNKPIPKHVTVSKRMGVTH